MNRFFCDPKTAVKNVAVMLLMVFLIVYAGFQILPTFTQKIETENALMASFYNTCSSTGYLFREESVIKSDAKGYTMTLVKDGERLSKGQHFANVYDKSDSAALQEQINEINRKIDVLSKSVIETNLYVTDIAKTDRDIGKSMDKIYAASASGKMDSLMEDANQLLVSMNKKDLIIHMTSNFSNEIASLEAKRASLEGKIMTVSKQLVADDSGYYYGDTDGFEELFDPKLLETITMKQFEELISEQPDETLKHAGFGKIVTDFVWYVACEVDKFQAAHFQENQSYPLIFPNYSEEALTMRLIRVVKNTSSDTALMIFRGNTAPEGFPFKRSQKVDIILNQYTGYAVPKKALRVVSGHQGVYILDGDIIRFRLVDILYENENYYLIAPRPFTDETKKLVMGTEEQTPVYRYIELYDSVIVKGKNLFDGKTVA